MQEHCRSIQEQKTQLKEDQQAEDAQLAKALAAMKRAPASKKMSQMAGLLTLLVEQRLGRSQRQAALDKAMVQHLMQHMKYRDPSLAQCPAARDLEPVGMNT